MTEEKPVAISSDETDVGAALPSAESEIASPTGDQTPEPKDPQAVTTQDPETAKPKSRGMKRNHKKRTTTEKTEQPTQHQPQPVDTVPSTTVDPVTTRPMQSDVAFLRQTLKRIQKELRSGSENQLANIEALCASALLRSQQSKRTHRKTSQKKKRMAEPTIMTMTSASTDKMKLSPQSVGGGSNVLNKLFHPFALMGNRRTLPPAAVHSGSTFGHFPLPSSVRHLPKPLVASPLSEIRTLTSPAESDHPICVKIREGLRTATDRATLEQLIQQAESHQIKDLAERGKRKLEKLSQKS